MSDTRHSEDSRPRSFSSMRWNEYTIRPALPGDIDVVMHQRKSMFLAMGRADDAKLAEAMKTSREFFGPRLADGRYRSWLVEDASAHVIAGAGVIIFEYHSSPLDPTSRRPMVVNVFTERSYRRRGIARKLMELIVAWCKSEGFRSVLLHASDEGKPLYESMGFQRTNEMRLMLQ